MECPLLDRKGFEDLLQRYLTDPSVRIRVWEAVNCPNHLEVVRGCVVIEQATIGILPMTDVLDRDRKTRECWAQRITFEQTRSKSGRADPPSISGSDTKPT